MRPNMATSPTSATPRASASAQSPAPSTVTAQRVVHRVGRALSALPRHGLKGTAARLHRWIVVPIAQRVLVDESHVWYTVPFAEDGDVIPEGFEFRRGDEADLAAVAEIGGVAVDTGRQYLARGAQLYVVTHGDDVAFCTWIHVGSVPLAAARGGWLSLPDGTVSVEDSLAAPDYRTTRISMRAIDALTALQSRQGVGCIITRIAEDNTVARKWARRMNSVEVATMRHRRVGFWRRVDVTPLPGGDEAAAMLAAGVDAR
jgi:hypothetical protein